MKDESLYLP